MSASDVEDYNLDILRTPETFFKPPPEAYFQEWQRPHHLPFTSSFREASEKPLNLRLIGKHPLWGHKLWNAALLLSEYFDNPSFPMLGKRVLELGAGAALPSLICLLRGAAPVTITDYPDADLVDNMQYNVDNNVSEEIQRNAVVMGHLWGKDMDKILSTSNLDKSDPPPRFDYIILADVIFNHISHMDLLRTCRACLREDGKAKVFVVFSHHKPSLMHKDLAFFEMARSDPFGFQCEKIGERMMQPMWDKDEGPAEIRGMVHMYTMALPRS